MATRPHLPPEPRDQETLAELVGEVLERLYAMNVGVSDTESLSETGSEVVDLLEELAVLRIERALVPPGLPGEPWPIPESRNDGWYAQALDHFNRMRPPRDEEKDVRAAWIVRRALADEGVSAVRQLAAVSRLRSLLAQPPGGGGVAAEAALVLGFEAMRQVAWLELHTHRTHVSLHQSNRASLPRSVAKSGATPHVIRRTVDNLRAETGLTLTQASQQLEGELGLSARQIRRRYHQGR